MSKRPRAIGTTEEALARAEEQLARPLPASFRTWLKACNGADLHGMEVFPVFDDRDPRKTWDSIVRQHAEWKGYWDSFEADASARELLPFVSADGDYYCFDYSRTGATGEPTVVYWSRQTGETTEYAESFLEFARLIEEEMNEDEDEHEDID